MQIGMHSTAEMYKMKCKGKIKFIDNVLNKKFLLKILIKINRKRKTMDKQIRERYLLIIKIKEKIN